MDQSPYNYEYRPFPHPLPPNFYPWLGICPQCGFEQYVSAYNVRVPCENCEYEGWRDDYKDNKHQPNLPTSFLGADPWRIRIGKMDDEPAKKENTFTITLTEEEMKNFLDWRVNREAEAIGRGSKCPRCGTNGFGLYQPGYCARCAYYPPSVPPSGSMT